MKMDFIRRTWAEIDLDALDYNIKSIKAESYGYRQSRLLWSWRWFYSS